MDDCTMQDVTELLPKHKTKRYAQRARGVIRRTVVHHSVTEVPEDSPEAELQHLKNIARRHVRIAAWPGIGYHFCVFDSGRVYQVNTVCSISYHVGGYNLSSVGVCLIGKLHRRAPTETQLDAAAWLVGLLGWTPVRHRKLHKTTCPGTWAWEELVGRLGQVGAG